MLPSIKKMIAVFLLFIVSSVPAIADVTQTITGPSTVQFAGDTYIYGDMSFAPDALGISSMTSYVWLQDQGYGPERPYESGVFVQLLNNDDVVLTIRLGGAVHKWTIAEYSLIEDPYWYGALNATIDHLHSVSDSHLSLRFLARCADFPLASMETQAAQFNVTFSNQAILVPEPQAYLMLVGGLMLVGVVARRRAG